MDDMMWVLLGLFLVLTLLLPWGLLLSLRAQRREMDELRRRVAELQARVGMAAPEAPPAARETAAPARESVPGAEPPPARESGPAKKSWQEKLRESRRRPIEDARYPEADSEEPAAESFAFADSADATAAGEPAGASPVPGRKGLEFRFGARLFLWIGAAALGLAAIFLVKYSIEEGLLSPLARVVLGGAFGAGLIVAGVWVRNVSDLTNRARIARALCGAGLVALYASLYAGTTLYKLIPSLVGFASMAGVTLGALVLATAFGPVIAFIGLLGGLVTPVLVRAEEPGAAGLFGYLAALHAIISLAARNKRWNLLTIPAMLGGFGWMAFWLQTAFTPGDALILALFVMVFAGGTVYAAHGGGESGGALEFTVRNRTLTFSNAIPGCVALGGSFMVLASITHLTDYSLQTWVYSFILAGGALALVARWEKRYWPAALTAAAAQGAMLFFWGGANWQSITLVATVFYVVYSFFALFMVRRGRYPALWAALHAAVTIVSFLTIIIGIEHTTLVRENALVFLWIGIALAFLSTAATVFASSHTEAKTEAELVPALLLWGGFVVVAYGMLPALDSEFLGLGFAVLLVVSVLARERLCANRWARFPETALVLAVIFMSLVVSDAFSYLPSMPQLPQDYLPALDLHLGFHLTAFVALLACAWQLERREDRHTFASALEFTAAISVFTLAGYLIDIAFLQPSNTYSNAGLASLRTITTQMLLWGGLGLALWGGREQLRGLRYAGATAACLGGLRFLSIDVLSGGPAFNSTWVGPIPILNLLLPMYILPALWVAVVARAANEAGKTRLGLVLHACGVAIALAGATLLTRQYFYGAFINEPGVISSELYAYSVVWLLLGAAMLVAGVVRPNPVLRGGSLAVVLLAVLKVFLYDASELEGLWRVGSFFGLGLSLIGLSVFYTQFVFTSDDGSGRLKERLAEMVKK